MGPSLIFDKSFLQSLSVDQAVWLDQFFLCNITPLFFIETLADIEKEMRKNISPEELVGSIAAKTPDYAASPNVNHDVLIRDELLGQRIEMSGRPIVPGGKIVELDGKTGVIFQPAPEEEAFKRWQKKEFLELERLYAKVWRRQLSDLKLREKCQILQKLLPLGKPKKIEDVKIYVDFYIDNNPDQEAILLWGLTFLGIPELEHTSIKRWKESGKPCIREFIPYFTHVLSVDLFFYIAMAAGLISSERPSNKVDLAYLYYLPFCSIFVSSDKLHQKLVPFFLRNNQEFIWGEELKGDLIKIDAYYDLLTDEVKNRGVSMFAQTPPTQGDFLVARIWDKYMNTNWRKDSSDPMRNLNSENDKTLVKEVEKFEKEAIVFSVNEARNIGTEPRRALIKKRVLAKKGKWNRFPPEVTNSKE